MPDIVPALDRSHAGDLDYLDAAALLSLGVDPDTASALLDASPLSGDRDSAVIEAARLPDLLAMLDRGEGRAS